MIEVRTYSDGSCASKKGDRAGGCAAVLVFPYREFDEVAVYSGEVESSIGRMELMGAIIALRHIDALLRREGENAMVSMTLDSKVTVDCMVDPNTSRRSNLDLWALYDRVARGLPEGSYVEAMHMPRNSNAHMAEADRLAGQARKALKSDLESGEKTNFVFPEIASIHPTGIIFS